MNILSNACTLLTPLSIRFLSHLTQRKRNSQDKISKLQRCKKKQERSNNNTTVNCQIYGQVEVIRRCSLFVQFSTTKNQIHHTLNLSPYFLSSLLTKCSQATLTTAERETACTLSLFSLILAGERKHERERHAQYFSDYPRCFVFNFINSYTFFKRLLF